MVYRTFRSLSTESAIIHLYGRSVVSAKTLVQLAGSRAAIIPISALQYKEANTPLFGHREPALYFSLVTMALCAVPSFHLIDPTIKA